MRRLVILKTGDTLEEVAQLRGDFDQMFGRCLAHPELTLEVIEVHKDQPLPDPRAGDAALITGSKHSVYERQGWVDRLTDWTRAAHEAGAPILGVCYGHQLLGHAFGKEVTPNPRGYEIGTIEVELTEAGRNDPLFDGLSAGSIVVNAVHGDVVSALPEGASCLAHNPLTEVQAFAIGPRIRAVQFHPEFDEVTMRGYINGRAYKVEEMAQASGDDPKRLLAEVLDHVRPTPHGPRILQNFVKHFVLEAPR